MKLFKDKFWLAYLLAIGIVIFIGYFDVQSAHSNVFGTYEQYTATNYTPGWWNLFWLIGVAMIVILCAGYYSFYRKDKSETVAIFSTAYITWQFGLADVAYFWLQGLSVPASMPWLAKAPFISMFGTTATALYISVIIGLALSYLNAKFLRYEM